MIRAFMLLVVVCLHALAQTPVSISSLPSEPAMQTITFVSGTTTYICYARSNQANTVISAVAVSSVSNANPGVVTATAHGFDTRSTPTVRITGATGGWTGLNGVWTATITGANTFTVPVDTSGFGAFAGQVIAIATLAPRLNLNVWAIRKIEDDGAGNLWIGWAGRTAGAAATNLTAAGYGFDKACSSRTTYSYQ